MANELKLGIPKGSLEKATIELFAKAGWKIKTSSRSYFPTSDDDEPKCSLVRPQEMAKVLVRGKLDVGIAGRDWVRENDSFGACTLSSSEPKPTSRGLRCWFAWRAACSSAGLCSARWLCCIQYST